MAIHVPIWPGSSSFFPGDTPFGFYDNDYEFTCDADKVAHWCARRLGYPIQDVELQAVNFYTCFEEAVTEYANQVNTFNTRDNLLNLQGATANTNLTGKYITPAFTGLFKLAENYGSEAGAGGNYTLYTGSLMVTPGQSVYDLTNTASVSLETGSIADRHTIEIRRVFHDMAPAKARFFDPFVGTGLGTQNMLDAFGFGNFSPAVSFMMMPLYADLLRLQAIEMNDQIRKSQYGFELSNNRMRITPIPRSTFKIHFQYYLKSEKDTVQTQDGVVSDYSNIPYNNIVYCKINDMGKQWIRKYTLTLAMNMLGQVRGKYSSVPIPNSEITLNGADLIAQSNSDREALLAELRETLETLSRQAQLERKSAEAQELQDQMNKIPMSIYIGTLAPLLVLIL
jgi:hypothetical protein